MPRKKTHPPLDVLINGRLVVRLEKASTGAISFQYDDVWLGWEHRFAVSLSLPLTPSARTGVRRSLPYSIISCQIGTRCVAERTLRWIALLNLVPPAL